MTPDMPLPMPSEWLLDRFNSLETQLREQHQRLRSDMNAGFVRLEDRMANHIQDDNAVADRVLRMETQREDEAKAAVRRGTWAGLLAAAGLSGAVEVFKIWLHR